MTGMGMAALGGPGLPTQADEPQSPQDAKDLVELAIREKVPVEVLERLVALQERVTERNARAAYFAAVAAFQEECPQIHKSKTAKITTKGGGSYDYTFAPLEEITRVIRPLLKKHGLSYSWTTEPAAGGILDVICTVRHIDGHQESSRFPVPTGTAASMSEAQKVGAALTYGRRQSLVSVLGIIASDDVDGGDPNTDSVEIISDYQAREIDDKITATGSDRARFLAFIGVDAVENIPASKYQSALNALDRKAAKAAR